MTPDFSKPITLWPANQARRQDVFFQPAAAWLSGATQVVALLMLEYDSTSTSSDKQDFRKLVEGLVRWTWAAAGLDSGAAVDIDTLERLYGDFGDVTLAHAQLDDFLSRHYSFHMSAFPTPGAGVEVEGTVFPMFPRLELVVGAKPAVSFSPADRTLSAQDIGKLRDYFRQLQAQFDTTSKANTIDAASITEFFFVGYARLLIRTGLQAAIDHLEAGGAGSENIATLVEALANAAYLNIAQMASRFLLHGFNLPEEVFGGKVAAADEGLYVSMGQQVPLASALDGDAYKLRLRMGAQNQAHIVFPEKDGDGRPALTYRVAKDAKDSLLLAQAKALGSVTDAQLDTLRSAQPKMIPPHRLESLHFALRNRVSWSSAEGRTDVLLPLSSSLRDHLRARDPNPLVDLIVWKRGEPTDVIDVPNADFAWATRLDLSILQIPDSSTGNNLETIFALDGSSEEHKDLLEGVWNFMRNDPNAVELTLLYVQDGGTTNPAVRTLARGNDDVLLLKANLSNDTGNIGAQTFSAALTNKRSFLQLIWEGLDTSGGGYYLHLPNIGAEARSKIFASGTRGTIQLLLSFTDKSDPIHDFNNCAVFEQELAGTLDLDADLILARSQERVPVLMVPPGFLGFEIDDRPEVHGPNDPNSGLDELEALYQLLGYQIQQHTKFLQSNMGLPIGPTEQPGGMWLYERLVPTFSLVPSESGDSKLPDPNIDPYRGVGNSLRVDTWWQDIYGNQLLTRKRSTDFPVRYTDPIIGINQWPSVSESYTFVSDEHGNRRLNLEFSFDTSSYFEDQEGAQPRTNRMTSDRAIVESAWYQLRQDDIGLRLTTSIDEHWSSTALDKAGLLAFLGRIYQFLAGTTTTAPAPFRQSIDTTGIQVKPAFIFEVQVMLTISRSIDRVLEDLKSGGAIKPEYQNVLTVPARLSPKYETTAEAGGLTIRPFAQLFQSAFAGLHLAFSEGLLYAVRLGSAGIAFDIVRTRPVYFALPPLANTLLAGQVPLDDYNGWKHGIADDAKLDALTYAPKSEAKQFEAIDINILARSFLVAVEKFLEPASLVPAKRLRATAVDSILQRKAELAGAMSDDVSPVLAGDRPEQEAQSQAKVALREQLLVDLVEGYDIETIVQFGVHVNVANILKPVPWAPGSEPRVRGQAKVLGAQVGEGDDLQTIPLRELERVLDFRISAGNIHLADKNQASFFTYLFDTKKPELLASVVLDLEFVTLEIEFDIQQLDGIANYEASNRLSFVLPDGLRQPIGAYPIPIPLRNYPQPPSLIQQTADADPTSLTELGDVRQWKYTIIYEHPDVSQDAVDCILQLNVSGVDNLPTASGTIEPPSGLFASLVNFTETYPLLTADLELLRATDVLTDASKSRKASIALTAFEALVRRVVGDWQAWTTHIHAYVPGAGDVHVEVSEEAGAEADERRAVVHVIKTVASKIGGDSILPILQLPGYDQRGSTLLDDHPLRPDSVISNGAQLHYDFKLDPGDKTFFGDSSIPDRKLTIENLDVIEHQNAWASVWLSRNKDLLQEHGKVLPTNPAFVFQTPTVRFNNMVTPFITNDEPWDIATLRSSDGQPISRTLEQHVQTMIEVLFPTFDGNAYEVRLSCRYAFALVRGRGLNEDLLTRLPILLGLRITPAALANYAAELSAELGRWLKANRPSLERAELLFVVDLFSKLDPHSNTSLPMLRITHLGLPLEHVADLDAILR